MKNKAHGTNVSIGDKAEDDFYPDDVDHEKVNLDNNFVNVLITSLS